MDQPSGIAVIILSYDVMFNDIEFGVRRASKLKHVQVLEHRCTQRDAPHSSSRDYWASQDRRLKDIHEISTVTV